VQTTNTWNSSAPAAAGDFLGDNDSEVGTVDAYIYTNQDGVYLMRYGTSPNWLTCTVLPVSGVSSQVQDQTAFGVTSTTLTGNLGGSLGFDIYGGTPPYYVFSGNNAVASVSFGSATSNRIQPVTVTLNAEGTTTLEVFDWYQNHQQINVTVNNSSGSSGSGLVCNGNGQFSYNPSSYYGIDPEDSTKCKVNGNYPEGTTMPLTIYGGTPPYTIYNPWNEFVQVTPVSGSSDTFSIHYDHLPVGSSGEVLWPILISDAAGRFDSYYLTMTSSAIYSAAMTLSVGSAVTLLRNQPLKVGIYGGYPPYSVYAPTDWYEAKMVSERVFELKLKNDAVYPYNGTCGVVVTYMLVMDSQGHMTQLEVDPDLQCGLPGAYK
jgi:hypothetical protein